MMERLRKRGAYKPGWENARKKKTEKKERRERRGKR